MDDVFLVIFLGALTMNLTASTSLFETSCPLVKAEEILSKNNPHYLAMSKMLGTHTVVCKIQRPASFGDFFLPQPQKTCGKFGSRRPQEQAHKV